MAGRRSHRAGTGHATLRGTPGVVETANVRAGDTVRARDVLVQLQTGGLALVVERAERNLALGETPLKTLLNGPSAGASSPVLGVDVCRATPAALLESAQEPATMAACKYENPPIGALGPGLLCPRGACVTKLKKPATAPVGCCRGSATKNMRYRMLPEVRALIERYKLEPMPVEETLFIGTCRSDQEFGHGQPFCNALIALCCDEPRRICGQ
jgi:hypothetical protein